MDGDLSHNPDELENKIKKFNETQCDTLIASRYRGGSKIINWPNIKERFCLMYPTN